MGFVGTLLADDVAQMSRVPAPSSSHSRLEHDNSDSPRLPPSSSSSSGLLHSIASAALVSHKPLPAVAPSEPVHASCGTMALSPSPTLGKAADESRSALCAFTQAFGSRLCVTSLSEGFISGQTTQSGSVPVPSGVLQLVEVTRLARAVAGALSTRGRGFQVTSQNSGTRSVLSTETVGVCLSALAGGHPRAAEVLISSMEASRNGEPFIGNFLSKLGPEKLSLAASSIDVLCDYPVVIAVGLLGYV